jgi:hypothetical protein
MGLKYFPSDSFLMKENQETIPMMEKSFLI